MGWEFGKFIPSIKHKLRNIIQNVWDPQWSLLLVNLYPYNIVQKEMIVWNKLTRLNSLGDDLNSQNDIENLENWNREFVS